MHHVPDRWQSQFDAYVRDNSSGKHRSLGASDFHHHVMIRFPDGSHAMFRHSIYLVDRELNEIALFTEHCGYHYFPLFDAEIELLSPVHDDVSTD